ncbi:FtsX-like permease family protein [Actinopolymorpha alba]|uniref:FtsX-like permease family protein n=1 Tax=Actinopolymorpha alba TaxID=533267 RepID=UPI000361C08F|nr:FtsX-like permease family protein [Actinopolymorpha alba]
MKGWVNDLSLGCRLALRGGRASWVRLSMTALGVGLAVAVLLLASSVTGLLQARDDRAAVRTDPFRAGGTEPVPGVDPILAVRNNGQFRDLDIKGYRVQLKGSNPPSAPGVDRLPGPGEIVVSPALKSLLSGPDGELLRPRFPQRIIGTIGPDGLLGPNELVFYAGAADLAGSREVVTIYAFGSQGGAPRVFAPFLLLLVSLGTTTLLIPVVIFLAASTRLASEARDRRLAALRLAGGSGAQVRRIAAGEAFVGAVAGLGAGGVLFVAGRSLTSYLTGPVFGGGFFASDIRPAPVLAVPILVAVPFLAVSLALFSLRRLVVEPLGVVRQARVARRRLWWRLLPFLAGGGLLAAQLRGDFAAFSAGNATIAGIVLLLLGVPAFLPWLIERTVHWLRGGGRPAWQLAVRRLQLDSASSARIVGGVATALAGGIALQALFIPAAATYVKENPDHGKAIFVDAHVADLDDGIRLAATLNGIDGVRTTPVIAQEALAGTRDRYASLHVATCPVLRSLAKIERCTEGDVFRAMPPPSKRTNDSEQLTPGDPVWFRNNRADDRTTGTPDWTIPTTLPSVEALPWQDLNAPRGASPEDVFYREGILATPGALAGARNTALQTQLALVSAPDQPDTVEYVRNVVAGFDWSAQVWQPSAQLTDRTYALIRSALFLGSLVVLILAALSLLVMALEQLRERRRPLAILMAGGVDRSVIAWSLLWQATIPIVLALAVAFSVGLGLATLVQMGSGAQLAYDWSGIAALGAAGFGAVLAATILTLPALWRGATTAGLRTE